MRIREVFFHDFRSFQGPRCISFLDPLTDTVRPITAIAGTNGTGKTTILEVIEAFLKYFTMGYPQPSFLAELEESRGSVQIVVEIEKADLPFLDSSIKAEAPLSIYMAVGDREKLPKFAAARHPPHSAALFSPSRTLSSSGLGSKLKEQARHFSKHLVSLYGGLIYFPHHRQLTSKKGGPIQAPPEVNDWLFHYSSSDKWEGSLEQLWVWQNYLDLEAQVLGQPAVNLKPFTETIEQMLGAKRSIWIERGRVWVTPPNDQYNGRAARVLLEALPAGEQQLLLLVAELTRHRRKGAVIMIDEPELSLHPTLQRQLLHYLRTFAREWDSQIILATHSLEILRAVHQSERLILDQLEEATNVSFN